MKGRGSSSSTAHHVSVIAGLNNRINAYVGQCAILQLLVLILGIYLLAKVLFKLFYWQSKLLLRRKHHLKRDFGEWAVITGATDGIGKAIALLLAKKGMKIFLISRSEERLEQTAEEIKAEVPTVHAIDYLKVDFSEGTTEGLYLLLEKNLKNLDIGILINNVGISYPHPLYYNEVDLKLLDNLVTVNVRAPLVMTRVVYPGMRDRRRGAIVCVGSGSSVLPSDVCYCAYSATKAAAVQFCNSLQAECADKNIFVQCQTPLLVTTKMSKLRGATFTVITPQTYAKASISAIENAWIGEQTRVSPYWVHALILWIATTMPRWAFEYLNGRRVKALYRRYIIKRQAMEKDSNKNL